MEKGGQQKKIREGEGGRIGSNPFEKGNEVILEGKKKKENASPGLSIPVKNRGGERKEA